jgi:hypothetical protein
MEILASLDDINANLPAQDEDPVIEATSENTNLIQVSVARVVRGYLARVIDPVVLMSWDEPANTPDIVRECAAKMMAAQLYFIFASRTTLTIDERSFAQLMYDEALAILNGIIDGTIVIEGVIVEAEGGISELDFFPVDDTDRAFTMSMEL